MNEAYFVALDISFDELRKFQGINWFKETADMYSQRHAEKLLYTNGYHHGYRAGMKAQEQA